MLQTSMLRNSALCFSLLTFCFCSSTAPAHAADSPSTKADFKNLGIWTDGFVKSDADKIIGLAVGLNGPLRVEGKVGVQQHADPRVADTEKFIWRVTTPTSYRLSRSVRIDISTEGAFDSLEGSYIQNLTGALAWTAQTTSELKTTLLFKSNLVLDTSNGASTLVVGPEWIFDVRQIESLLGTRTQVKAGIDYNAPSNGAASLLAKVELKLFMPP